jgi:hypothetical protein
MPKQHGSAAKSELYFSVDTASVFDGQGVMCFCDRANAFQGASRIWLNPSEHAHIPHCKNPRNAAEPQRSTELIKK